MSAVLVINAGSSSLKYQLIDPESEVRIASGLIERMGTGLASLFHRSGEVTEKIELVVPDHSVAFAEMTAAFARAGCALEACNIVAVGHRVVQGGDEFVAPTLIDDAVIERISELSRLAPLHNPANQQAIVAARAVFADVPHVAVFDTAFHQTMPPRAYTYAIDASVAKEHGVRRYGFHGTSHQVVSKRAADFLGQKPEHLKQVVLHLGNGASVCAVDRGRSIETSMGLTPLEGLVMGTRSGDVDPGVVLHLLRAGYSVDDLDVLLNQRSGLRGLAGSHDMRDVRAAADAGDEACVRALEVYVHRIRHYLGAYLLHLGGADTIVFTGGVGQNSAPLRAEVCAFLDWFGVRVDDERNEASLGCARRISTDDSRISVLVVPTDEEVEIARQSWQLVSAGLKVSGSEYD